jgi:hypothetical protein
LPQVISDLSATGSAALLPVDVERFITKAAAQSAPGQAVTQAAVLKVFAELDLNNDGAVTAADLKGYMQVAAGPTRREYPASAREEFTVLVRVRRAYAAIETTTSQGGMGASRLVQ